MSAPDEKRLRLSPLAGSLFSLAWLLLLLAALEFSLRALGLGAPPADVLRVPGQRMPDTAITLWDELLFYRLRPDTVMFGRYHINGQGRRGPSVEDAPPPGTLRLVATGDSSTFGLGVNDDETWPAQLQRILGGLLEGAARVEVVNGAVPGYSTEHNLRQLRRDLLPLRPDVLLLCPTGQNDASLRASAGDRAVLDDNSELRARLDQLHVVRMLGLGHTDETFRADGIRLAGDPDARPRVSADEFVQNLHAIAQLARQAAIPAVYIVTPHDPDLAARVPDLQPSEQRVLDVIAQQDVVRGVDVRADFAAYAPHDLFSDQIHFIPLGQQLIALGVARALCRDPAALRVGTVVGTRGEFVAAWAQARERGVAGFEQALGAVSAPPLVTETLAALALPDIDARLAAGDETLPAALRAFDPLHGSARSPWHEGAFRLAARSAAQAGRAEEASAWLARAAEVERHVAPTDVFLALLGGRQGWQDADARRIAIARALVVLEASIGATPPGRDRRLSEAVLALRAGDAAAALALVDEVLALAPACHEARYQRGLALRKLGRGAEGKAELAAVVAALPGTGLAHLIAGVQAFEAGDRTTAETELRAAIAKDATASRARVALARILIDRGDFDEAERHLRSAAVIITDPVDVAPLLREIAARRAAGSAGQQP